MSLNLPKLDQTIAIVTDKFRPTITFHQWWDKVVKILQTHETTQDEMIIDIQDALTQAGIAINNSNAIMPDVAPVTVTSDYTGTVLTGQLPRNVYVTRFNGSTDVTTSSTWSATTVSGGATYTIGAATGILNITALTTTTVIEVTSTHNSISRSRKITINKVMQDPPPSSSSGTQYDSSINPTTSSSYGAANAGILTLTCGASGTVSLAAPLSFTTTANGAHHAYGKWQYSLTGAGVWTDVGVEIQSDLPASGLGGVPEDEGSIYVSQNQNGLTPTTVYDFQLLLRNSGGSETLNYVGTASASTS